MEQQNPGTITSMSPNIVTFLRIGLVFLAIDFYTQGVYLSIVAFFLTLTAIFMDSLDGYLARKLKVASEFGALLDIAGDRIVENVFWIFWAAHQEISYWVPIIIVIRGFLVDLVRSMAFTEGKTPFGEKTMMRSAFTRFLVASPFSRSTYAVSKVLAFGFLGGLVALRKMIAQGWFTLPETLLSVIANMAQIFVYVAVVFCVLRGVPVLWDGRFYVLAKRFPKEYEKE